MVIWYYIKFKPLSTLAIKIFKQMISTTNFCTSSNHMRYPANIALLVNSLSHINSCFHINIPKQFSLHSYAVVLCHHYPKYGQWMKFLLGVDKQTTSGSTRGGQANRIRPNPVTEINIRVVSGRLSGQYIGQLSFIRILTGGCGQK